MGIASVILGALACLGYLLTGIPVLGFVIDLLIMPLAVAGIVLGALGIIGGGSLALSIAGLILSCIAFFGGIGRFGRTFRTRPVT